MARALAGHLRANSFERWLLAEALDRWSTARRGSCGSCPAGSTTWCHDKGEFFVVDHHDAGLRRGGAHAVRR